MEFTNYEWFITQTVEAMLPRFTKPNCALGMTVDLSWTDYGYDETGNNKVREERSFRKSIFLLFHRPHNYTKVLYRDITEEHMLLTKALNTHEEIKLEQKSDHDSCWRSDGMNWMFKTFMEAWNYFKQFGVEGRKIDPSVHYSIFSGGIPQYYKIELKREEGHDNRWSAPYLVKLIEKIPMNKISEYMPERD
jgi:hypothetical protein